MSEKEEFHPVLKKRKRGLTQYWYTPCTQLGL